MSPKGKRVFAAESGPGQGRIGREQEALSVEPFEGIMKQAEAGVSVGEWVSEAVVRNLELLRGAPVWKQERTITNGESSLTGSS